MAKISINGVLSNVNPTDNELGAYQKHGLSPTARKPNDYLRMVARTFSTFRNTPSPDTVVSYINGFDISVNEITVPGEFVVDPSTSYNIFYVKAGACIIDDQLIDIFEDTYYIFSSTDFVASTKYGIVVEYDYINQQQDNTARIRFITYDSLHFPREDKNVVVCDYVDTSLSGASSTVTFSGKPGLLIGTFATDADNINVDLNRQIIQSSPAVPGSIVPGIDPQYLSKLYVQNYKLLFEYFGSQSRAIYSSMGMTNANFIAVSRQQLDITGNTETDLRSGDMCYFDDITSKYKRSVASRQKFSQVIGLYLNEVNEGNHLIYTGGFITCDAVKHGLPADHTLVTMTPGAHYFLEDSSSLFDSQNQIRTIDNYILADSSGRISNRFYPSAVMVGVSTACNQIVLNIDHSNEIGAKNLISLIGTFDEYKKEYDANDVVISSDTSIGSLTTANTQLQLEITNINMYLGTDSAGLVNNFVLNYATEVDNFTYLIFNILTQYFTEFNSKTIYETTINYNETTTALYLSKFTVPQISDIESNISSFKNLRNILNLLNENNSDIISLLASKQTTLTSFISNFETTGKDNQRLILEKQLKIARYKLGDVPSSTDDFENYQIISDVVSNFLTEIAALESEIATIVSEQTALKDSYFSQIQEINKLKSMLAKSDIYVAELSKLIASEDIKLATNQTIIDANLIEIDTLTTARNISSGNILNGDSNKLDIFQMDDYQRMIFNYTYITDRLQKRLILIDTLNTDLLNAQTLYEAVHNNPDANIIEEVSALNEVNRIEVEIQTNRNFITNYTTEYNKIRIVLGLPAIIEGDINFSDGGKANQQIGTYRYGCDDFETSYGGLATNLITSACGPYTSADNFIISKNSSVKFIDVLANDGHSLGKTLTLHTLDLANHGTSSIVTQFMFIPDVLADTALSSYSLVNSANVAISFVVENNTIIAMNSDSITDMNSYVLLDSNGLSALGTITVKSGVSYIPADNYVGPDVFSYSVIDPDNKIATGTIHVEVTGPYTTPDTFTITTNSADNILNVLANDGHTGGSPIILMSTTAPDNGTISFIQGSSSTTGEIKYTPNLNYIGTDSFTYSITDGAITVDSVTGISTTDGSVVTGTVTLIVQ